MLKIFSCLLLVIKIEASEPQSYVWEYVPSFAQATSYVSTAGGFVTGALTTSYIAEGYVDLEDYYSLATLTVYGTSFFVGFIGSVVGAYVGKKIGQQSYPYLKSVFQKSWMGKNLMSAGEYSWKAFKYAWDMKGFTEQHFRRKYLQGTLYDH